MERTYIMAKPDGVQRNLVGEIIGRFEKKGYKLVALKVKSTAKGCSNIESTSYNPSARDLEITGGCCFS